MSRRAHAMRDGCPYCGAEPRQQCINIETGRLRISCHAERHGQISGKHVPKTYVYVIADTGKFGPVKVGITQGLKARLSSLQTGYHSRLKIHHAYSFPSRTAALKAERRFHAECGDEHGMMGEWFGMAPSEAAKVIERFLPCSE